MEKEIIKNMCIEKFYRLYGKHPGIKFIESVASIVITDSDYPNYNDGDIFIAIMNQLQENINNLEHNQMLLNGFKTIIGKEKYKILSKNLSEINYNISKGTLSLNDEFEILILSVAAIGDKVDYQTVENAYKEVIVAVSKKN